MFSSFIFHSMKFSSPFISTWVGHSLQQDQLQDFHHLYPDIFIWEVRPLNKTILASLPSPCLQQDRLTITMRPFSCVYHKHHHLLSVLFRPHFLGSALALFYHSLLSMLHSPHIHFWIDQLFLGKVNSFSFSFQCSLFKVSYKTLVVNIVKRGQLS